MQSTEKLSVVGLDLAKFAFRLHIIGEAFGEIHRRQIKCAKLAEFFAKQRLSLVAMKA